MPIQHKDLKGVVLPYITIDEFEPKSGESADVIVIAFYTCDQPPAKDLNTFIQRGTIDILDSDVSPNVDEEGRYLVFVELERNPQFRTQFDKLVKDVENTTGPMEWLVKPYLADEPMEIDDKKLNGFIIDEPNNYLEKADFKKVKKNESLEVDIKNFLQESYLNNVHLTDDKRYVIFNNKVAARIIAFGDRHDSLVETKLINSALSLFDLPVEVLTLRSMLGESWEVEKMDDKVVLSCNTNQLLIVSYPEYIY